MLMCSGMYMQTHSLVNMYTHTHTRRSYSWSANVCGCKEWLLLPPGEEDKLRDSLGNLPMDITSRQLQDHERYPQAHRRRQPLRVIQSAGEIIFVPRSINSTPRM